MRCLVTDFSNAALRAAALLFITTIVNVGAAAETNWPEFRGPAGNGHTTATGLPLTWSETENIRWSVPIHGKGWSSPVVWGTQIWMTTATEDGKQRFAICVDAETGKMVHDVVVFDVPDPQYSHPMNSHATPTPVIEEGRVYLHFGSTGTMCLDTKTAKTLWLRQDLPCNHFRGAASSPILVGNLLVVSFDGFDLQYVVALDKQTGETVWKSDRNIQYKGKDGDTKKAYGTCHLITVGGQQQLIAPAAEATIAYVPQTGEELWRVRHGGMNVSARPLYGLGRLYLNTGAGGLKMLAVRPEGKGDITDTNIDWTYAKAVPTRPSYLLVGDLLFAVNDSGIASCLDANTGKELWQKRFGGDYCASPLYAEGRVYFFCEDGRSPVVEASSTYNLLAENMLGDGYMASPAVTGKALILRSRTKLYRVEKK